MPDDMVPLAVFSAALDEIYALRQALAYEALVVDNHLAYRTFPKSRRDHAEQQVARMQACARGDAKATYDRDTWASRRHALREAGASDTLTSAEWQEKALPASLRWPQAAVEADT